MCVCVNIYKFGGLIHDGIPSQKDLEEDMNH